ncbi:MAG: TRAP transporter small permease [Alphaproteobacteria bacterium]
MVRPISKALELFSRVVLVALVGLVCTNAVLRYVFDAPIVWADQITGYGMVYITFLVAPWVLAQRRHIAVDLLQECLSPQTRPLLGAVLGLVGFLYNAGFTWLAWSELARILARDSQFSDAILVPQWMIYWVLPVGSGLMALEFALNGIEDLRAYLRGAPAPRVAAE